MRSPTNKLTAVVVTILLGIAIPAVAQPSASTPAVEQSASGAQPLTKSEKKKQLKAQRKAARKEARARNRAEMKKLEDTGYNPTGIDPNYPAKLQDAQKKANAPASASQ